MKKKILGLLKVIGVGALGAVVANQDAVAAVVPPKYQSLIGVAFGLFALFTKRPQDSGTPPAK